MDDQPKLRPQTTFDFFPDQRSSRAPVPGTIARNQAYSGLRGSEPGRAVYPFEDLPVNTGQITGTTNFVESGPFEITPDFIEWGRQRYQINCWPCHGPLGDGNGITKKLGMAVVANLHDPRIVQMPDGEIFNTITHGKNLMLPYGPRVPVTDRWAIIAYVRALQLSRLAAIEDVPAPARSTLP
jgi:hypothetical protein